MCKMMACLVVPFILVCSLDNDVAIAQEESLGLEYDSTRWGICMTAFSEAGGLGISILSERSPDNTVLVGFGYSQNFPLSNDIPDRHEMTLFIVDRYYVTKSLYFLGGLSGRKIDLFRSGSYESISKVSVGSIGIPFALGWEFGRFDGHFTTHVEIGYAKYIGPGANDIEYHFDNINRTMSGSSGLLSGVGLNYYF